MMSEKRMVSRFPFLDALYLAFYSRPFYRNVARFARGMLIGYFLFLICIAWVPQTISLGNDFREFLDNEAPKYLRQMPKITIRGGKASIAEPVPYYIQSPDGSPFAIIDTSGTIRALPEGKTMFLVTEMHLIVRTTETSVKEMSLADFGDVDIDRQSVTEWLEAFSSVFAIILFPFAVFFSFLLHLPLVFVCTLYGNIITKRFGLVLDFKSLFRLAVVAFTPAMILQTAHGALDIPFPYRIPITLLVSLGYLSYGIFANIENASADIHTH